MAVVMLLFLASGFITDWMWFAEMGYISVFFKGITTEFLIGIPVFLIVFLVTDVYLRTIRKRYFDMVRSDMEADRRKLSLITNAASAAFALLISWISATGLWYDWLMFTHPTGFDIKDPMFHHDISFYIFRYEFLKDMSALLISVTFLYLALTLGYYCLLIVMRRPLVFDEYINETSAGSQGGKTGQQTGGANNQTGRGSGGYGQPRPIFVDTPLGKRFAGWTEQAEESIPNIRKVRHIIPSKAGELFECASSQLVILGVVFFLLLAYDCMLRQYDLLHAHVGVVYGAGFTAATVILWTYRIISILAVLGAVAIALFLKKKQFKKIALIPLAMAIVAGAGILGAILVQSYIVSPDELNKETKYLQRNIDFTQHAYQLKDVDVKAFSSANDLDAEAINENSQTISNVRINDYKPVNTFYNQTQSIRQYYTFNDVDVDRYMIDGELTQTYLAVREIDDSKISNTWLNRHIKYTHGYGITLSRVDTVTASGQPDVLIKNIPPQSSVDTIDITQPRVYFGEITNDYSLVNTNEDEFDYPDGDQNKYTRYDGTAGIKLGLLERIVFAIREKSLKLLVSTNINSKSKILINRNVVKRVTTLFPHIKYEADPYCVTVDGNLYWIVDAYTTSSHYPYSEPYTGMVGGDNYVKNSIKVVVDAYNGTTDFYIVDDTDPIAATLKKVYPKLFKDGSEMPEKLREHIRYPENLFRIQAQIYTRYHMDNVKVFYQQEDMWDIAHEIYGTEEQEMTSNYYIVKLPGEENAEFINQIPFTPKSKQNMTALMIARNDGDNYGKLVLYKLPKSKTVYGPMQIEAQIDQNTEISRDFTLWSNAGSKYSRGNMFVVPVNDSLLYIEPVYLEASNSAIPEMKRVIVMYNDRIAYEPTLGDCLKELFGVSGGTVTSKTAKQDSGSAGAGDDGASAEADKGSSDESTGTDAGSSAGDLNSMSQSELAKAAQQAYDNAQDALKDGDWAKYGEYMDELEGYLDKLAG
ncbi:MAG: UPF0182 family protein [Eubacterium sp.]|nr:UPF0182 family protein [Eubacterium sp.]